MTSRVWTIGFANLNERDPAPIQARQGLEAAAARLPQVRLVLRDNDRATEKALANMQQFADLPVDLAILFHLDERHGMKVIQPALRKKIPVISMVVPIPMTWVFGLNNEMAGQMVGQEIGSWVQQHWEGKIDHILVLSPSDVVTFNRERTYAALLALAQTPGYRQDSVLFAEEGVNAAAARQRTAEILERWPHGRRIVVLAMIDYIAVGALEAIRAMGREEHVVVGSFDSTDVALEEFRKPFSRLVVAPSFHAERFGEPLLQLSLNILEGRQPSRRTLVEPTLRTREQYQR